jgi:Protein of unknown function (DUF2950)
MASVAAVAIAAVVAGEAGSAAGAAAVVARGSKAGIPMKPIQMTKECLDLNSHRIAIAARKALMFDSFKYLPSRVSLRLKHSWPAMMATISAMLLASLLFTSFASADETASQQTFPSPDAAVKALIAAAKADDMKTLSAILGPDASQILSSGDPVADNNARDNFVHRYEQMHRLAYDDEGRVILYVGAENWPTPIPLVKKNNVWSFDTDAGKDELLSRRVGRNELFTIDVLEDLSDAQDEYASEARDGGSPGEYAQKILSDPGKHNGLYWKSDEGQPESPIGPLVASATAEGYKKGEAGTPIPFHGYYYKVLTSQGKNAPGGAKNYLVDGKMTKGYAFLAYPAEYRASGVMTFMIDQNGVIVQKDLGSETGKVASEITEYNPDKTWDEVDED